MSVLISVIVPVYNADRTLNRCVESILGQSNKDFELILVDDGSQDFSSGICDRYAESDTRVSVIHKSNGGVSSARNIGLENARGEWITFIDSDDWIEGDFLSSVIGVSSDIVVSSWKTNLEECVTAEDKHEEYASSVLEPPVVQNYLASHMNSTMFRTPWSKFFRSEIIRRGRIIFDSSVKLGEDTLFILDYLKYVQTVSMVSSGKYVYTACDFFSKYNMTSESAGKYLDSFCDRYFDQQYKCDSFVFETVYVYSKLSSARSLSDSILYVLRPSVLKLKWQYVRSSSFIAKAKWIFMKINSVLWYQILHKLLRH